MHCPIVWTVIMNKVIVNTIVAFNWSCYIKRFFAANTSCSQPAGSISLLRPLIISNSILVLVLFVPIWSKANKQKAESQSPFYSATCQRGNNLLTSLIMILNGFKRYCFQLFSYYYVLLYYYNKLTQHSPMSKKNCLLEARNLDCISRSF